MSISLPLKRLIDVMIRSISIFIFFKTAVAFGQTEMADKCYPRVDTLTKQSVYIDVDKVAMIEGGTEVLAREVAKRVRYPQSDKMPVDSKVIVAFIITAEGKITGKRILKHIEGTDLADQFLTIISDLEWEPGRCNGKPVSTLQVLPMILCAK